MLEGKDEGNSVIGKTTKSDPLQLEMDDHFILRLPLVSRHVNKIRKYYR